MKKYTLFLGAFLALSVFSNAQDNNYQKPPADISSMLLARPAPSVSTDDKAEWMLMLERDAYPGLEELAKSERRIAGLRFNPDNYARSRQNYTNNIYLKQVSNGQEYKLTGLPTPLNAGNFRWSPNDKKVAFTNTTDKTIDLYQLDIATRRVTKLNKQALNSESFQWFDNNTLLYTTALKPASAAPKTNELPKGPAVQETYGKASPRPTYQDMIKSPADEATFEFYYTGQLVKNVNGVETKMGNPDIFWSITPSPDKKYLLVRTIKKPFSYLVPASGFPSEIWVTDASGKRIKQIADLPGSETAPSGYDNVQMVKSDFQWRDDQPATVVWSHPLDSGMVKKEVEFRDAVYQLEAPFTGEPKELFKTKMRFQNVTWGNNQVALVSEGLRSKQSTRLSILNPMTGQMSEVLTRNTTDTYNDPGRPVTVKNEYGQEVLALVDNGNKILLNNTTGSSPQGDLPFLNTLDIRTLTQERVWRSPEGSYEYIVKVVDPNKLLVLTRHETSADMPNYRLRNLLNPSADRELTEFANPYPQMEGVSKQKIKYRRADGVVLTGDLYLPKGYDPQRDGKLPAIIWAYPREFSSAADAAQIRGSEHRFTLLNYGSPVYYVTQGYAVLNNAEMPIVATAKDKKPNDDFVDQLRLNAEAAINVLDSMGVGDRNRMAVGGHSYGAFMTANLLAHTDLFKAGIARSGAYNRSLTPFGFQNEDRTYWQAPQLYFEMSPFSYANKINEPILLIHGEMDNNTGTYPIQSERLYNAIKGHGGQSRYVVLPYESHGYMGRQNLEHLLWEQLNWLDRFVKNPK